MVYCPVKNKRPGTGNKYYWYGAGYNRKTNPYFKVTGKREIIQTGTGFSQVRQLDNGFKNQDIFVVR
jgi:hypothetical protein